MAQRIDGSWTDKSLVATFLNTCCTSLKFSDSNLSQFLSTVTPLLKVDSEGAMVTLILLAILHLKFKNRRNEWNLIEKKAKKYLSQSGGIANVESAMGLIILP